MAKAIATLSVSFTARISRFQKGLKRMQKSLRRFGRQVRAAAVRVAKFGAAMAAAAVGGMALLIRGSLKSVDAISKMSDRLGISTEAIVGLQHAAAIYGVEQEALNKGLEQFVRRLGEAQTIGGDAKKSLDRLGLSADALARMPADQAFAAVADRLGQLETQTLKADTAYRLFGRQGVKLLNLLQQGKVGIRELTQEAARLGVTFNRKAGAAVENLNDDLFRLRQRFTALGNQLAITLSPILEDLVTAFNDVMGDSQEMARTVLRALREISFGVVALSKTPQLITIAFADMANHVFGRLAELAKRLGLLLSITGQTGIGTKLLEFSRSLDFGAGGFAGVSEEFRKELEAALAVVGEKFAKMMAALAGSGTRSRGTGGGGAGLLPTAAAAAAARGPRAPTFGRAFDVARDVAPGRGRPRKQQVVDETANQNAKATLEALRKIIGLLRDPAPPSAMFVPAG